MSPELNTNSSFWRKFEQLKYSSLSGASFKGLRELFVCLPLKQGWWSMMRCSPEPWLKSYYHFNMKKYSKIFHQTSSGFKSLVWTNIIKTVFICSKHIISQCRLCISLKLEIKLDIQKFIIQGGDPYLPPVCHQGETGRGPRKSHIVLFLAVTSVTILLVLPFIS